ncbi:hypothetical protein NKI78_33205, partial [Mesorhizobium sp. M0400]
MSFPNVSIGRKVDYHQSYSHLVVQDSSGKTLRSGRVKNDWELSGILCARPVSSLADEPFAEDDGELG